jgi:hypothetical protein
MERVRMMDKNQFMAAHRTISAIEDLFDKADDLFRTIPPEIQDALRNFHSDTGNLEYCIRWGLTAAGDLREDWHTVVSGLEVAE